MYVEHLIPEDDHPDFEPIAKIRAVVADHTATEVHGVLVDAFTASAIVAVYDALADKAKANRLLETPHGLVRFANFAMTHAN